MPCGGVGRRDSSDFAGAKEGDVWRARGVMAESGVVGGLGEWWFFGLTWGDGMPIRPRVAAF